MRTASSALSLILLAIGICSAAQVFAEMALSTEPPRVEQKDSDGDGKIDRWITYQGKKPIKMEADRNKDGKIDVWGDYHYTYSAAAGADGKQEEVLGAVRADRNHDGRPDFWRKERNRFPVQEWGDLNYDGKLDFWSYYTSAGQKQWVVMDKNFDDKPDLWSYYGDKGEGRVDLKIPGLRQPIAVDIDENFDGKPDRVVGDMPKERPSLKISEEM